MDLSGILSTTGYVIEVIIGVSLIIFVHELGHFLAAKWAGVKVRRFFFGFAPAFKIGKKKITLQFFAVNFRGTKYGVGMLPFGGFVDMAGEYEGDKVSDVPKEQQFNTKTPGQRAVIFVAGAVMNALFAIVFFVIAFLIGVSFVRPTVGDVVQGGPAWQAGIEPGDKILEINGREQKEFTEMLMIVALSAPDTTLEMKIQRGERVFDTLVTPEPDARGRGMTIGITTNFEPVVGYVQPDSPADRAGLEVGDRIAGIEYTDPETGREVKSAVNTYLDVSKVVQDAKFIGKPVVLEVLRGTPENAEALKVTVVPVIPEQASKILGVPPLRTKVMAIKHNSPANEVFQPEDIIRTIQGKLFSSLTRLKKDLPEAGELSVEVERDSALLTLTVNKHELVNWLENDIALKYNTEEAVLGEPHPEMPAGKGGIQAWDRVVEVDGKPVEKFTDVLMAVLAKDGRPLEITWQRHEPGADEETFTATLTPASQRIGFIGIMYTQDRFIRRKGPFGAIATGFKRTILWGKRVFLVLKGLFTQSVSVRTLAGPVGIFTISYAVTQFGLGTLFYFLAMISINLAILNVFPVPVLDGGHLLFLGIEKIKGSPVSIKTQVAAQTVGLVLLLSMAVFVTINDITRLFTGF